MPNGTPSRTYRPIVLALLSLSLAGVGTMVYTLEGLRTDILLQSQRFSDILWRTEVQTLTTTWTSGGSEWSVVTNRREGEGAANFAARHDEVVTAMQELHPPDET